MSEYVVGGIGRRNSVQFTTFKPLQAKMFLKKDHTVKEETTIAIFFSEHLVLFHGGSEGNLLDQLERSAVKIKLLLINGQYFVCALLSLGHLTNNIAYMSNQ